MLPMNKFQRISVSLENIVIKYLRYGTICKKIDTYVIYDSISYVSYDMVSYCTICDTYLTIPIRYDMLTWFINGL